MGKIKKHHSMDKIRILKFVNGELVSYRFVFITLIQFMDYFKVDSYNEIYDYAEINIDNGRYEIYQL